MRKTILGGFPLAAALLAAVVAVAGPNVAAPTDIAVRLRPAGEFRAGATARLDLVYDVPAGMHLTTTFAKATLTSEPAADFGEPVFPPSTESGGISYWLGDVTVGFPVTLPDAPGPFTISVVAGYQLCEEGDAPLCFPPGEIEATWTGEILPAAAAGAGDDGAAVPAAAAGGSLQDRLLRALERGSWLAFLMVFLGGVLASLTPCVYPMIPITITYIGGGSGGNPLKGFVMSLWYVLGIAVVYSALGLVAAATGGAFGQATQTPLFARVVAAVIGAMALSMAGLFDLQVPSGITSRVGGARGGFLGPVLMGMTMGLVAAPCVGPVLIVLLTWVAATGSMFLGFWLLFTFALGLGLLFVLLGTFSSLLTSLPGAGAWMETIKHVFAVVLYGLALYFLKPWLPSWLLAAVFGLALLLSVSAWGAWTPLPETAGRRAGLNRGFLRFLWLAGAVFALLGGLRGLAPELLPAAGPAVGTAVAQPEPDWIGDDAEGFARARESGKPVMMDFWAEWCAACLELDHRTYNQPGVLRLAERFEAVKMDMTRQSPENAERLRRYGVIGMPTVIFFDSRGDELERFSGFIDAEAMAEVMGRVLERAEDGNGN